VNVVRWGETGDRVLLVHGSFGWGEETWSAQRPLADRWRLEVVDRPGFGETPAEGRVDFERDADLVATELAGGAHLVGHSYGGVVSLLAAAARPSAVLSLTVIEPPAFDVARGDPVVEASVERVRAVYAEPGEDPSAFRQRFLEAFGFSPKPLQLAGKELEAARASMTERIPFEARIPLDELAAAPFPTLVVRGSWEIAPRIAREVTAPAFHAVCDVLVQRLGAESETFDGTAHNPQQLGAPFNERVEAFWRAAR